MDSHRLHVAINAQLVSFARASRNAGLSRYTYTLLAGLAALHGDQRYTAFVNPAEAPAVAADPLAAAKELHIVPTGTSTTHPARRVLWEQLALPSALKRMGADVFHSPVNVLPLCLPLPSVVTVHDLAFVHYPQYFRPTRRVYQRVFTRRSARHATRVVAVSANTKQDLIDRFHVPAERIRVIYPAIADHFRPITDPAARAAFRARLGLPERYLLFLGTLEPRKNLPTLVEAYARLRALSPDAPPLIIAGGKGWYYQTIFDRVRALNLEGSITFAGYVLPEDQPLWYSCAELFIYPSVYEGFGFPVVEALACGVPTITSDVSSLPEAGGPVAIQVAPTDPDTLAHALHDMLADPGGRTRALVEGPRWAQQFSAARMARAYADLYREALEAARGNHGKRGR
jgi:glycosyltransferase involved in cell wall biosynthesis